MPITPTVTVSATVKLESPSPVAAKIAHHIPIYANQAKAVPLTTPANKKCGTTWCLPLRRNERTQTRITTKVPEKESAYRNKPNGAHQAAT